MALPLQGAAAEVKAVWGAWVSGKRKAVLCCVRRSRTSCENVTASVHMLFVGSISWKPLFNPVLSPDKLCCSVRSLGSKNVHVSPLTMKKSWCNWLRLPHYRQLKRVKSLIPNGQKSDKNTKDFLPSSLQAFFPFLWLCFCDDDMGLFLQVAWVSFSVPCQAGC